MSERSIAHRRVVELATSIASRPLARRNVRGLPPMVASKTSEIAFKTAKILTQEVFDQLPEVVIERLAPRDVLLLNELQRRVFCLDYYGELSLHLDRKILEALWDQIVEVTSARVSYAAIAEEELQRLRAYQEFEERIHEGYWPTIQEGVEALDLKSADVVLLKKFAILLSGKTEHLSDIERHRAVAVAREILDDLQDVNEDFGTLNFNLFLAGPGSANLRSVSSDDVRCCADADIFRSVLPAVGQEESLLGGPFLSSLRQWQDLIELPLNARLTCPPIISRRYTW